MRAAFSRRRWRGSGGDGRRGSRWRWRRGRLRRETLRALARDGLDGGVRRHGDGEAAAIAGVAVEIAGIGIGHDRRLLTWRTAPTAGDGPGIGLLVVAAKQRCPQALAARGGDRALVRIGHRIAGDRTAARQDLGLGQLVARQGAAISGDVHGLLIGEQPHELVARHARPGADRSDIEMDEGRVRVWIEADAATLQTHPDLADSRRGHVGQVEVHRLAEHVLAVLGDGARATAQHGVGVGRAIGGHDVEGLLGAELALHLPDDIEQARVHADRLVGAPIPQGPVQLLESGGNIAAILLEGDRRLLLRMHVHDGYGARIAVGDGVLRATDAEQERGHREAEQRGAAAGG